MFGNIFFLNKKVFGNIIEECHGRQRNDTSRGGARPSPRGDGDCIPQAAPLTVETNVGTIRETFFLNQLRSAGHRVSYPPQGDFLVDGHDLFEIGGAGKKFGQIKDVPDSFVAADGMETGVGNKIPLWLFGFLY